MNNNNNENPFQEAMKQRYEQIRKMAKALGKCDYRRFVALVQINFGVSKRTAVEYVQTLRHAGYIGVDHGNVCVPLSLSHTHSHSDEEKDKK